MCFAIEEIKRKAAEQAAGEARRQAKQEVKEARQQAEEDQARIVAAAMGAFGVNLDGAMKALGIDEGRYPRVRELVAGGNVTR